MNENVKKFLYDIKVSIESIEKYLGDNQNFNKYLSNKMLRRAIEREFEIIGEAMNHLVKLDENIKISAKKLIIGMRNRVIHGYDKIDNVIIWGTIVKHLPLLKKEVTALLDE
jgi:uncharacterized protein with HEPN domain